MDWRLPFVFAAIAVVLGLWLFMGISTRISHGIEEQIPTLEAAPPPPPPAGTHD